MGRALGGRKPGGVEFCRILQKTDYYTKTDYKREQNTRENIIQERTESYTNTEYILIVTLSVTLYRAEWVAISRVKLYRDKWAAILRAKL